MHCLTFAPFASTCAFPLPPLAARTPSLSCQRSSPLALCTFASQRAPLPAAYPTVLHPLTVIFSFPHSCCVSCGLFLYSGLLVALSALARPSVCFRPTWDPSSVIRRHSALSSFRLFASGLGCLALATTPTPCSCHFLDASHPVNCLLRSPLDSSLFRGGGFYALYNLGRWCPGWCPCVPSSVADYTGLDVLPRHEGWWLWPRMLRVVLRVYVWGLRQVPFR